MKRNKAPALIISALCLLLLPTLILAGCTLFRSDLPADPGVEYGFIESEADEMSDERLNEPPLDLLVPGNLETATFAMG